MQLVVFLMLHRHLRPGYDYLLSRTLLSLWARGAGEPAAAGLQRFVAAARELGFAAKAAHGAAGLVAARVLIQSGDGPGRARHR